MSRKDAVRTMQASLNPAPARVEGFTQGKQAELDRAARIARNQAAMALLDEWLAEDRAPMEGGELPDEEPLEIPPFSLREVPVE